MGLVIGKGERFKLKELLACGEEKFIFNKEYQRSAMWSEEKKQYLLDSIIKNYSIGSLMLKVNGDKFEVLDGQQRLRTIFEFVKPKPGKKPLITSSSTEEFPEKSYEELQKDPRLSAGFDAFEIIYDKVFGGTDQEVASVFLRLQEGMALNVPEKLNAMLGKMRDFVYELSRQPIFKNGVKIGEYRFTHRHIAAQITLLELGTKIDEQKTEFPDLRFGQLKEMYKKYRLDIPAALKSRLLGTTNFLYQSLGNDAIVVRKKSDLPLIYSIASHLRRKYVADGNSFKEFITEFFTNVANIKVKEIKVAKGPFEQYAELRRKGLTLETFTNRFNLLLGLYLTKYPNILLKDPKRSFDVGQKLAIYYFKDKGICQYCPGKKEVEWNDASFHHLKFRSKGGPTTVENGQLMHKKCHEELHKNQGKDLDIF